MAKPSIKYAYVVRYSVIIENISQLRQPKI